MSESFRYNCTRHTLGLFRSALLGVVLRRRVGLLAATVLLGLVGVITGFYLATIAASCFILLLTWHSWRMTTRVLRPLTEPGTTYQTRVAAGSLDIVTPVNEVRVPFRDLRIVRQSPATVVLSQSGSGMISVLPREVVPDEAVAKIEAAGH